MVKTKTILLGLLVLGLTAELSLQVSVKLHQNQNRFIRLDDYASVRNVISVPGFCTLSAKIQVSTRDLSSFGQGVLASTIMNIHNKIQNAMLSFTQDYVNRGLLQPLISDPVNFNTFLNFIGLRDASTVSTTTTTASSTTSTTSKTSSITLILSDNSSLANFCDATYARSFQEFYSKLPADQKKSIVAMLKAFKEQNSDEQVVSQILSSVFAAQASRLAMLSEQDYNVIGRSISPAMSQFYNEMMD